MGFVLSASWARRLMQVIACGELAATLVWKSLPGGPEPRSRAFDRAAIRPTRILPQCMETDDEDIPSTGAEVPGNGSG